MVSVPNPVAQHMELLDDGGNESSKITRLNATVKQLQKEMGLLNVKLAQQQDEMAQQRRQMEHQMEQQRQQNARLMAIVESTTISTGTKAVEDNTSYLPQGWTALESEDGETYYEKPDGSVTWDLPWE